MALDFAIFKHIPVYSFVLLTFLAVLNMICLLKKHGQLTVHVSHEPMGET